MSRRIVVLQPGYIPWLGYFDQMGLADIFVHLDDVQYDKGGWRNRNKVKTKEGLPFWLTVPVYSPSFQNLKAIKTHGDDWRIKHTAFLRQRYPSSVALDKFQEMLYAIPAGATLLTVNYAVIDFMRQWLGVKTQTVRSSELALRSDVGKTERLVAICKRFNATSYLSGPSAKDYLDVLQFADAGVSVEWHAYWTPPYQQTGAGPFVPNLSALDAILNLGTDARRLITVSV